MERLIRWLIRHWLKEYHLARNPSKRKIKENVIMEQDIVFNRQIYSGDGQ